MSMSIYVSISIRIYLYLCTHTLSLCARTQILMADAQSDVAVIATRVIVKHVSIINAQFT